MRRVASSGVGAQVMIFSSNESYQRVTIAPE